MASAPATRGPFADHWEHLDCELARLDLELRRLLRMNRNSRPRDDHAAFSELSTRDDAIDGFLADGADVDVSDMDARIAATLAAGVDLALPRLARLFELTRWEVDVILLCLASELDSRYERVFGYLADDLACRRPTSSMALDLLTDDHQTRAWGASALSESGRLHRYRLIEFEPRGPHQPGSTLRLDRRISEYLTAPSHPASLPSWSHWVEPFASDGQSAPPSPLGPVRRALDDRGRLTVAFHGSVAVARLLTERLAAELRQTVLVVDVALLEAATADVELEMRRSIRESLLAPAVLELDLPETAGDQAVVSALRLARLSSALSDLGWLTFIVSTYPVVGAPAPGQPWLTFAVDEREAIGLLDRWRMAAAAEGVDLGLKEAMSLASRYRFGAPELRNVFAAASLSGAGTPSGNSALAAVEAACRDVSAAQLGGLAERIRPRATWDDVVLPDDTLSQIREIEHAARGRAIVLDEWGLAEKLSHGRGLSALFSGPPGTGKTMAAEVLAGSLRLDLYVVELATVVSKYIGETEKNLARIFDASEVGGGVLFFDEADALFGKRSEVKDAHDRYANIEVSYLLQRIESHTGLVILATNLKRNLDEAFLRRLSFLVEFPFPGNAERELIWRSVLPPRAPLAADIRWERLAEPFPIAGGNIRSAALHASYQAAAAGRSIEMADLLRGVRRELDKLGKAPRPEDFGIYWERLKG